MNPEPKTIEKTQSIAKILDKCEIVMTAHFKETVNLLLSKPSTKFI